MAEKKEKPNAINTVALETKTAFPGFASGNNAVQTTGLGDYTTPTWVTILPMLWVTSTTLTAGTQQVRSPATTKM